MFEDKTYENLMDEMLANVDESLDTREGSIIHETIAPIGQELELAYQDLGLVLNECFGDTASYYYLIKRAAERGVIVQEGTAAVIKIQATPSTVEMEMGTQFTIGDLSYSVTENLGSGLYNITCQQTGVAGNNTTDDIIPMEDVEGLEAVEVVEIVAPGTDDEDVEHLRQRYYESFQEVAFGGNQAEYKEKAKSFQTVFGAKVYPVWQGGGTVKLKILGADYKAASAETVAAIQEAFDPTQDGTGVGIAPIGHIVTVDTVTEEPINVSMELHYSAGANWNQIKDEFAQKFEAYLLELRKTWDDNSVLIVRMGEIERIVLSIQGVEDTTEVLINGVESNYTVAGENVPIGGDYNG